jgi:peptidyl-prolyl cis-trans isomerase A (cyclophilin A)
MIRLRFSSMQKLTPGCVVLCVALVACEAREPEPFFAKEKPAPLERAAPSRPVEAREQNQARVAQPTAPVPPPTPIVRDPTSPDPLGGKFDLKAALAGLPGAGKNLKAAIETGMGTIECKLFADKTPNTVANFVGLARGLRPFWDAKQGAWVKRPLFDGTSFHRTIADFMIQGGDHMGDGTGQVGYNINDELVGLKHDRAGLLCMANRGPNTNGGQFFITDAAAPHLTQMNTYTIFGDCTPTDLVHKIATSSAGMERPASPVPIKKVTITR